MVALFSQLDQDIEQTEGLTEPALKGVDLWLGKPVPRYTSYPPAPAFHDSASLVPYKTAVAALPAQEAVSLYLHVPYCQKRCLYCACNTEIAHNYEAMSDYLYVMQREIRTLAGLSSESRKLSKIHFGGGSPNMMSEKDMGLMMNLLSQRFNLGSVREISMELDPRLVTVAQSKTLRMIGVTRVSLGVQDFDPEVQKAIGRVQPYAQVLRACFDLREAGIQKINLDLMYGLPHQTPETMEDAATLAASLKPDRIALFSYAHVPQVKKHQQALEKYRMPSGEENLHLEQTARQTLLDAGYVAVGMDHFALPHDSLARALNEGTLRRTFQGYTDDTAKHLLGVGASSIGFVGDTYFQNARDVSDYRVRVRKDGLAVMREFQRTEEDKFRGALIEKLMCQMEVDVEAVCAEYGMPLSVVHQSLLALAPFEMAGVIDRRGYRIKLAIPHRMAIRMVASLFDAYGQGEDMPVSRVM